MKPMDQVIEQAQAMVRDLAVILGDYFKCLQDNGFNREEALDLVISMQERLVPDNGGNDE